MSCDTRTAVAALALAVALASCAHRVPNEPLAVFTPDDGYRFDAASTGENNTNSLFVCVTLSGGGTRAAAFSYGVLQALEEKKITWPSGSERRVRLLDEVDVISSVSGGSFTAAYYGLYGDGLFTDFEQKFLYRDIQGELFWAVANPLNWPRLWSPRFDRIDLAAELYHETVFDQKTFADIQRRSPRPFVVLNATNMTTGAQFSFRQEQFDIIGSDLSSYPVANGVAASSAFPLLLNPVTLQNHPAPAGYEVPRWISLSVEEPQDNPRGYQVARSLLPYATDKEQHPYVHLVDGGLADNLGLRMVIDEYRRGFVRQLMRPGGVDESIETISNLLIIVVNAKTEPAQDLDQSAGSPGALDVAYKAATVSMENYTFETVELMREDIDQRNKMQVRVKAVADLLRSRGVDPGEDPLFKVDPIELHVVELSFDDIVDPDKRQRFLDLPTSFALEPDQVRELIELGHELLDQNEDFQEFLQALD